MSDSQKGEAEAQRQAPLQNHTDSFFEEKALILSPKLCQEDNHVKHGNSLHYTPLGEEGECNNCSLLAGVGIASPGEVKLTAPLDASTQ